MSKSAGKAGKRSKSHAPSSEYTTSRVNSAVADASSPNSQQSEQRHHRRRLPGRPTEVPAATGRPYRLDHVHHAE
ncbi:hypothetical protein [Deinococcus peraridilitoris]|uniref:hypothetical protein n=1 Tax=Deinococcus peraridilitoris TaxID=432329 RepID=UPI0012FC68E7|nr:hypothetical protein [Deinococcus peraridilitoris]